jgi:hypothetical protein
VKFQKKTLIIFGLLWLIGIGVGMYFLIKHENTPGVSNSSPVRWPAESRISLAKGKATLIMFGHPHCPCTRTSVGELAMLMARSQGRLEANVLFLKPTGVPDNWEKTDIWQSAAAIPGVKVVTDSDGVEARRFLAKTSGYTVLYGARGELLFSGGITGSRGHSGDNVGRSSIVSLLNEGSAERSKTFVFGCSLFE